MTVLSLVDNRLREGKAKCTHCHLIWDAVSSADLANLECPRCQLKRGVWYGLQVTDRDEEHFTCCCGNTFFELRPPDILCIDCGTLHPWTLFTR
jgi:hypothetical protein